MIKEKYQHKFDENVITPLISINIMIVSVHGENFGFGNSFIQISIYKKSC